MSRPVITPIQVKGAPGQAAYHPPATAPLEQALPPTYFFSSPPEAFFLDRAAIPAPTLC